MLPKHQHENDVVHWSCPPRARGLNSDHSRQPAPLFTVHNPLFTIHYQLLTIHYLPQKVVSSAGLDGNEKSVAFLRTGDAGIEFFCYNIDLNWHIKEEKTEWVKLKLSQRKKPQA